MRALRVETRRRLVQDDQLGLVDQRLGQADALAHALGVLLQDALAIVLEADALDQLLGPALPLRPWHVEEPAVEIEGLFRVQKPVQVRFFRQEADALVLADLGSRLVEHVRFTLGGEEQSEQQLDGGRLAGAVRPEQAENLAAADL